jgi:hypothetical protein
MFTCLLAALVHDAGHPGSNNKFESANATYLSSVYDGQSPLEQLSLDISFTLLLDPRCNVLQSWSKADTDLARIAITRAVLDTDMSRHAALLKLLRAQRGEDRANKGADDEDDVSYKVALSSFVVHAADLSNACRPLEVAKRISTLLADEVFLLAERERELAAADALSVVPIESGDIDLVVLTNKSSSASVSSLVSTPSSLSSVETKGDSALQLSLLSPAKLQQSSQPHPKTPKSPAGQSQGPSTRAQRIKFEQNELGFFSSFVRPYFAALADHAIPSLGPDLLVRIDRNIALLSASISAASAPVTPSSTSSSR